MSMSSAYRERAIIPSAPPIAPTEVAITGVDFGSTLLGRVIQNTILQSIISITVEPLTTPALGVSLAYITTNSRNMPNAQLNFTLQGGVIGTRYIITMMVQLSDGEKVTRSIAQPVEMR